MAKNAAGRGWKWGAAGGQRCPPNGKAGSYGGAGCGEQPAKVLLAGGLSPARRFLDSLRSLGMTIRDLGPGMTKGNAGHDKRKRRA